MTTQSRRTVPILDITIPIRTEGFTTEWVMACSWCRLPSDHGDHADCQLVVAAARATLDGAPLDDAVAATLRAGRP